MFRVRKWERPSRVASGLAGVTFRVALTPTTLVARHAQAAHER
jgi:hypothetical protein